MNRPTALAAALLALSLLGCPEAPVEENPPPPPPPPPPVVVETFQAAGAVLGQADFTSATGGTCVAGVPTPAGSFNTPIGAVAWDGSAVWVPDTYNWRLLGFSSADLTPLAPPIGAPDRTTCEAATSPLYLPTAPSVSGTKLVVADPGWGQVLVWDAVPTAWDAAPDRLFGGVGVDFGGPCGDVTDVCSGACLNAPQGALVVGATLVVADTGNHRVLLFDLDDATAPFAVLGQVESDSLVDPFDQCAPNDTDGDGAPGRVVGPPGAPTVSFAPDGSTLNFPTAVWSDGTRLAVADTDNNRILIWNDLATIASGQAADVVVGQASFTTANAGASATGLSAPQSIASDGEQLFVADTGNHRVLVYPSVPTVNGAAATIVLGQSDFGATHVAANAGGSPSAQTLSGPTGVAVVDGMLAITDTGNGRVVLHLPPAAP